MFRLRCKKSVYYCYQTNRKKHAHPTCINNSTLIFLGAVFFCCCFSCAVNRRGYGEQWLSFATLAIWLCVVGFAKWPCGGWQWPIVELASGLRPRHTGMPVHPRGSHLRGPIAVFLDDHVKQKYITDKKIGAVFFICSDC